MKIFINLLTIMRLIATFIIPLLWKILNPLSFVIVIILILLTDLFDGFLARKTDNVTLFGAMFDTIADKAFGIVATLFVASFYKYFYAIVVMELVISIINLSAAFKGAVTKASFLEKVKTWVMSLSIVCGMICIFKNDLKSAELLTTIMGYVSQNEKVLLLSAVSLTVGAELMVAIHYFRKTSAEISSKNTKLKYHFKKGDDLKYVLFDTKYYLEHKNLSVAEHILS